MKEEKDYKLHPIHEELLDILSYIHETLVSHNMWYTLAYGTAIGAIRENGFIEWDRDADVLIKLPDREKIRKVLKANMPDRFEYIDASKDNVNCFDNIMSKKFGQLAEVDIYTVVGAPSIEGWSEKKKNRLLRRNKYLVKITGAKYADVKKLGKKYKVIPFMLLKGILHLIPNRLIRCIVKHYEYKYDFATADRCMALVSYAKSSEIIKKEVFDKVELHAFEGKQFCILSQYDTYLRSRYGNYMIPTTNKY